jgi:hypothetical protein
MKSIACRPSRSSEKIRRKSAIPNRFLGAPSGYEFMSLIQAVLTGRRPALDPVRRQLEARGRRHDADEGARVHGRRPVRIALAR